jgi:hypothetical protein
MNLLNIGKWNDLLIKLNAHSLFKTSVPTRDAKLILAGPVIAARQILKQAPHLLAKDNIRICVAGSDFSDTGNQGDLYRLLPTLLNKPELSIAVDFIGPDCLMSVFPDDHTLKVPNDGKVTTSFEAITLGSYLSKGTKPNVIIMNMPGFEKHADDWFDADNGVWQALTMGIPVLGSSYGNNEAELDKIIAISHGFNVDNIEDNALALKKDDFGFSTWAGQTWELKPGSGKKNQELMELCKLQGLVYRDFTKARTAGYHILEIPKQMSLIEKEFCSVLGGKKAIWLDEGVFYFPELHIIQDLEGNVLAEDVSVDTTYTHGIKNEFLRGTFTAAILRRDYEMDIQENDEFDHEEDDESDFDPSRLLSKLSGLMGSEGGMSNEFMDRMRLSRPMSPRDFAVALKTYAGWDADVDGAAIENEHLRKVFSIKSNGNIYPVYVIGLGSTIGDYHHDADPMLIDIMDSLSQRCPSFILLVGEGCHMIEKEGEKHHHQVGIIYKNLQSSFLFLSNVEPDDQHGRLNIEDDIVLPEWSVIDKDTSYQYSVAVLRSVTEMFSTIGARASH